MQTDEFQAVVAYDEHHWWYRGRRRVIAAALSRLEIPRPASLLDAGCGSGRTMDELRQFGPVTGFDLSEQGVAVARARGHEATVARVEEIPHGDDSFDLVTCLDVLEHTPDDVRSLAELRRVTRPGGHLLVTVPAYQLLWSSHDVANEHYRRYRRPQLLAAASTAGWEPVLWSYFNSILLPAGAAVRLGERLRRPDRRRGRPNVELTPSALNPVLEVPMRVEAEVVRRGGRLPAGMSLLAVLRRPLDALDGRPAAALDHAGAGVAAAR
jgi:SAM-dependent methyltransferase